MQRVVAVDVAADLIGWLPGQLTDLGWSVKVADVLTTKESAAVYTTGGVMRDMTTDSPTIVVECVAGTKQRTAALMADIRSLVHYLEGREVNDHAVQRVNEFSGPAHLPSDDRPNRYTITLSLDVSAVVVG